MRFDLHHITYLDLFFIQHLIFGFLTCIFRRNDYLSFKEDMKHKDFFSPDTYPSVMTFVYRRYIIKYILSLIFGFFAFAYYIIKNKSIRL